MQFSITHTTTALVAALLMMAPVTGSAMPGSLQHQAPETRALDFQVKFWTTSSCKNSGPVREYNANTCLELGEKAHAVSIVSKKLGCWIRRYKSSDCSGAWDNDVDSQIDRCYDTGAAWNSLKFLC
ncbi:hypothetical protein NUW58_g2937 [Xylaria curta]|uniref:Uncharacterized protein n=1 Tax=Xylaria curta TaxID=42375 RepID=A0ACC1PEH1_9PEZI|nr:hypothetical protein NUW58_g2937 [Xylaria curta]